MENSAPLGATKLILSRSIKECISPELFIVGKCVLLIRGVVAFLSTGDNSSKPCQQLGLLLRTSRLLDLIPSELHLIAASVGRLTLEAPRFVRLTQ